MIPEDAKVKFAVVGCGHIGRRHAQMVLGNPEAELTAICDVRSRDSLGIDAPHAKYFSSLEELLVSPVPCDVVSLCTANGLHAPLALQALEKGKHVVCEKPMALTTADCEAIIYKALQRSRQVFCVMQNRYSPPALWLKETVEKKRLGEIFMVQTNVFWNRDERYYRNSDWKGSGALDGGTLFTQFSHFIDMLYWLFGDISDIQARFANCSHRGITEFEDSGMVTFRFLGGGMGVFSYSTSVWDKNMESGMTVIGSNGTVKISGQYMDKVEYCHIRDYHMPPLPQPSPRYDLGEYKGAAANHHFIIENVIDTLKGRTTVTTNALEGMKVVDIIQRIYSQRKPEM